MTPPAGRPPSPLESVLAETVALFHRLRAVAEEIHGERGMTAGKRGILVGLARGGPQTVPQMGRARPVSRQYVQTLVNQLAKRGLVEFVENPVHKRSLLVRLTARGRGLVDSMTKRETALLAQVDPVVVDRNLRSAARVLRAVREMFESQEWARRVRATTSRKGGA